MTELRDVAGEFTRAHREADEDDVAQIKGLQQDVQVGCEGVVVVAGAYFRRLTEPATVVRDDPVPRSEQLGCLALPTVSVQRITVDQYDGLTRTKILVVELNW